MSELPPQPPPPPKKTNWWVWVLVGCGGLLLVGGILCGGCMWWFGRIAQSAIAMQKEVDSTLRNDPRVQEEFGDVREITPLQQQHGQQTGSNIPMKFQVVGSKRTGTATAIVSFDGSTLKVESISITRADGTELKIK